MHWMRRVAALYARFVELMLRQSAVAAVAARGECGKDVEDISLLCNSPHDITKAFHICRVHYCSREHQRQHWKAGGHRKVCKGRVRKDVVNIEAEGDVQVIRLGLLPKQPL